MVKSESIHKKKKIASGITRWGIEKKKIEIKVIN